MPTPQEMEIALANEVYAAMNPPFAPHDPLEDQRIGIRSKYRILIEQAESRADRQTLRAAALLELNNVGRE